MLLGWTLLGWWGICLNEKKLLKFVFNTVSLGKQNLFFRLMEKMQMVVIAFKGTSGNFQRLQEISERVIWSVLRVTQPQTTWKECQECTAS